MIVFFKAIKKNLSVVWRFIEFFNGIVVSVLYGRIIKKAIKRKFRSTDSSNYKYRTIYQSDLPNLERMITNQPEGFDNYFKPHNFDMKTLKRMHKNQSFLMFGVFDKEMIIGYFFLRLFANRTAYRGKMVDFMYQGKGIAKEMGRIMSDIAFGAGFRLFATISKLNHGSMASSAAVNEIHIIKELPDDYLYIEYC